jgi:transcriptional regulator with XRE-family HTH domain
MSMIGGQHLKRLREQLGLSMRDVEEASLAIARRFENPEFHVPISRISDIESKGVLPNIFRLFSLSTIYGKDYRDVCGFYGIDWDAVPSALQCAQIPKTHLFSALRNALNLKVPTVVDPAFDVRRTTNVVRMIQKWGAVPAAFLSQLATTGHTYAFVGTEDFTMYPIIMPGTFLQVDETRTEIINEGWRSEYERPVYFIETREEFICAWCKLSQGQLMTQPHPLSPATPRVFRHPQEAEVIGRIVGIAMRLGDWEPDKMAVKKTPVRLN